MIVEMRKRLGLTQLHMGQLLGVHFITISRWERGTSHPNPHSMALMECFDRVSKHTPELGENVKFCLAADGVTPALYILLSADKTLLKYLSITRVGGD